MQRRPLSVRRNQTKAVQYDGPYDGVPPWLAAPLEQWLRRQFSDYGSGPVLQTLEQVLVFAARLRLTTPIDTGRSAWALDSLVDAAKQDDETFLDLIDLLLEVAEEIDVRSLATTLDLGGSSWEVCRCEDGTAMLEDRVSDAARQSFGEAISSGSSAAHALASAWSAAYGRNKDPKEAYSEAITAVEAALQPIVLPADKSATLGKIIGQLKSSDKYGFRIEPNPPNGKPADAVGMISTMAQVLWQGQQGRHGEGGDGPGPRNTIEQSQDAVHLATTLVQWSESGAFHAMRGSD